MQMTFKTENEHKNIMFTVPFQGRDVDYCKNERQACRVTLVSLIHGNDNRHERVVAEYLNNDGSWGNGYYLTDAIEKYDAIATEYKNRMAGV